jgi:hypothetical protein
VRPLAGLERTRRRAAELDRIADWADGVARAGAADGAGAVTRAAEALTDDGEPYLAARLHVDLLPFLDADPRARRR